jgi:hypothetical protein
MISSKIFKLLGREKVYGVLFAEFVLFSLALAVQGFSVRVLCLFLLTGWIWSRRPRLPEGVQRLPGPWGELL